MIWPYIFIKKITFEIEKFYSLLYLKKYFFSSLKPTGDILSFVNNNKQAAKLIKTLIYLP